MIARHIAQLRQRLELFNQSRRPRIQLFGVGVGVFKTVLELGTADSIVHRDVLDRLHKQRDAFNLLELGLQAADDVGGARFALIVRFEIDLHSAAVDCRVRSVNSNEG